MCPDALPVSCVPTALGRRCYLLYSDLTVKEIRGKEASWPSRTVNEMEGPELDLSSDHLTYSLHCLPQINRPQSRATSITQTEPRLLGLSPSLLELVHAALQLAVLLIHRHQVSALKWPQRKRLHRGKGQML